MKILTVLGWFLDIVGVVILGVREVTRGAAALWHLKESYPDSFDYDVQQRPWYTRPLLVLGAKLGTLQSGARRAPLHEPPSYREFPWKVCGFFLLIVGLLLQLLAALYGSTRPPS
jgi:hypothetical protein